jgi:acetyl-CoA carboxylase carboxyl transferase subunit beta
MGWFDNIKSPKLKQVKKTANNLPTGLWKKCSACSEILQMSTLEKNAHVCPYCDHHYRLSSFERIEYLVDEGTWVPIDVNLTSQDPLQFTDKKPYQDRLKQSKEATGLYDSAQAGYGKILGTEVSIAVMDFTFMGGSMGVVCGEIIAVAMDKALERKIPCIVISCSGGARMQEGILSLMQMAKTSASRNQLKENKIPYISILTDPTTGGCAASFAMQGDINFAEPHALIGFAGPRVIEQSIRQTLPEGFQRSEFLKDHGFIDRIVHRHQLKKEVSYFVKMFTHG